MWDPETVETEPPDLIDADPTVVHTRARSRVPASR
jgi:hypothetical protein